MIKGTTTMLLLLICIITMSCDDQADCSDMGECLAGIDSNVKSALDWGESDRALLNNSKFLEYYATANDNYENLVAVIESDSSEDIRLLAVLIAQGLSESRYLEFCAKVLDAYSREAATGKLVAYCIFPGESWGTGLVERTENPEVQTFLRTAENLVDEDIVSKRISAIRDGSYESILNYLRESGQEVPIVRSKIEEMQ